MVQGIAYKVGFWVMAIYLGGWGTLEMAGVKLSDLSFGRILGLVLELVTFGGITVFSGAYFPLRQSVGWPMVAMNTAVAMDTCRWLTWQHLVLVEDGIFTQAAVMPLLKLAVVVMDVFILCHWLRQRRQTE